MAADPVTGAPALRLFYALWPDDATRAALTALQDDIDGRPTAPANLHLTLAFLGQQPAAALPQLEALLRQLPAAPLALPLNHCGYFPPPKIAWIGPEPAPAALLTLQRKLVQALTQLPIRYQPAARFLPHVTLARHAGAAPPSLPAPIRWRSSQIALACSETLPQGARYRVLAARQLDH